MKKNMTWKKPFFSVTYSIYSTNQVIGMLKDNSFSQTAIGELNDKKYTFKTKGFFMQITQIIDNNENKIIGTITYNNWMTKATISISGRMISWKYDNAWNTKWRIYNDKGLEIKYSGSSTSGKIESNSEDALLILCGLFVTNYYWQVSVAVMVAIFIPILTAISN